MNRILRLAVLCAAPLAIGCYHFTHEHRPPQDPTRTVTYSERQATYLNGFVGEGTMDVKKYCDNPVRTELRVTAVDVLLSVGTLLIYTPHTLYVTCDAR